VHTSWPALGSDVKVSAVDESTAASSAGDGHRARSWSTVESVSGLGVVGGEGDGEALALAPADERAAFVGPAEEHPHTTSSRAAVSGSALMGDITGG